MPPAPSTAAPDPPERAHAGLRREREATLRRLGFSPAAYRAASGDLEGLDDAQAWAHLLDHGLFERRRLGFTPDPAHVPRDDTALLEALAWSAFASAPRELDGAEAVRGLLAYAPPLRPLLAVGESHSALWGQRPVVEAGFMPAVFLRPGASARGIGRAGSHLGFGRTVQALLDELARDAGLAGLTVIFKLGQVDLEFVHPLKRLRQNQPDFRDAPYADFLEESAGRYAAYLRAVRQRAPPGWRILCQDVFPPTLSDATLAGRYVNLVLAIMRDGLPLDGVARPLLYPDLAARTAWHARFNALLDAALAGTGVERLRDFDLYLGPDGTVDPRCIPRTAGGDHHLDFDEPGMAPFVAAACARLEALLAAPRP